MTIGGERRNCRGSASKVRVTAHTTLAAERIDPDFDGCDRDVGERKKQRQVHCEQRIG